MPRIIEVIVSPTGETTVQVKVPVWSGELTLRLTWVDDD